MKIQVENSHPIPDIERHHLMKYPWDTMKLGQSFDFDLRNYNRITTTAYSYGRRHERRFTVRTIDRKANLCRIWRVW
jgi:hypothetical protein